MSVPPEYPVCMVGKPAPAFAAQAVMADGSVKELKLSDYAGKPVVLFFYPFDFTFVCPSEIIAFSRAVDQFAERGVQVIGCSIDSAFVHSAWRGTPLNKGGIGDVKMPLLADTTHSIAKSYGVYLPDMGCAFRGLFVLDKDHIVKSITINDLPLGRSTEEAIRVVDAMQFHEKHGEVCPANWKKGDKAMKPTAEGAADYLKDM